jgi:hypothetical protein
MKLLAPAYRQAGLRGRVRVGGIIRLIRYH